MVVVEGRVELMCPMDPAAVDDHHDLFPSSAESRHHLMEIVTKLLGIKVRHDFLADFRRTILHCSNDTEQHATGDPAPGTIAAPPSNPATTDSVG